MTFTLDISRGNVEQALSFLREAKENIDMALKYAGEICIHTEKAAEEIEEDIEFLNRLIVKARQREQEKKDKAEFERMNPNIPALEGA